jgi:hypothetical protein
MPKILCICETIIDLFEIPSINQLLLIEDVHYDKFNGSIDSEKLYKEMLLVARCKECKRLYIYENGFNTNPIIYKLERGLWKNK